MKTNLIVYRNGEKVNNLQYEGDFAKNELINILIYSQEKKYKISLFKKDHIERTLKINLIATTTTYDKKTIKYKYEYIFSDIDSQIDLHY